MKASVMEQPGKLFYKDTAEPQITEDEILFKVLKASICNSSDFHVFKGTSTWKVADYPFILGHEQCGEIVKIGGNIKNWVVGDRITMSCMPFAFAEFNSVKPDKMQFIVKLDEAISAEEGALAEMLQAALIQTVYPAKITNGERIVVLGQGPMGLVISQLCKLMGADVVAAVDLNEFRLKKAEEVGVNYTYNRSIHNKSALVKKIKEDIKEIDLVINATDIDLSSENDNLQLALEILRPGGRMTGLRVTASEINSKIDYNIISSKCVKIGRPLENIYPADAMSRQNISNSLVQQCFKWIKDGKLKLKDLITHHIELPDVEKALTWCKEKPNETIKIVINME